VIYVLEQQYWHHQDSTRSLASPKVKPPRKETVHVRMPSSSDHIHLRFSQWRKSSLSVAETGGTGRGPGPPLTWNFFVYTPAFFCKTPSKLGKFISWAPSNWFGALFSCIGPPQTFFLPPPLLALKNNAFNKTIMRHNQLRSDLGFSSWKEDCEIIVCKRPHLHATAPTHKSLSQFLIAIKTRGTIASPHISIAMTVSASTMERKHPLWY
jgi:hypothetical protein